MSNRIALPWLLALAICGAAGAAPFSGDLIENDGYLYASESAVQRAPKRPVGCCWVLNMFPCKKPGCCVSHAPEWERITTRIVYLPRWHPTLWLVWLPREVPVRHGVDCEGVIK